MIVIGLTGSIGMGKSTVAEICRTIGIEVENADEIVHQLMRPGGPAFAPISAAFPETIIDGKIDRKRLGDIAFLNDEKLALLEGILHPLVAAERAKFLARCREEGCPIVVLDIPLLFEKQLEKTCDVIMTVSAPPDVQKARVMARPGMTEEKFNAILARQMPDAEKRARSDYVVDTSVSKQDTLNQLLQIFDELV